MPVFRPRTNVPHSFPERPARQLRGMALRPISLNAGTPYPCTAGELRDAINPNRHSRRSSDFIIADQASYEVYAQNARGRNLGRGEYNAMCRLEECIVAVFRDRLDWTPDLIIKAFCDLDRVFFCGRLRGYVRVRWVPGSYFPAQRRTAFGYTEILGGGKAEIVLNADGIFSRTLPLSGFLEMFRTMLHEMCHAYEYTQVAQRNWEDPGHGVQFGTKILAVDTRARHELHLSAIDPRVESFDTLRFSRPRR